jgi:hypothetical protein
MECPDCARLRAEFERLERSYAMAVDALSANVGITRAAEYTWLRAAADEARIDSEVARLALEQHRRVHAKAN